MNRKVRVRFAPSPTGGLHLGGVRTVLYNYLFAKQHGGDFILRIEDTDQSRYVPGAEEYIYQVLTGVVCSRMKVQRRVGHLHLTGKAKGKKVIASMPKHWCKKVPLIMHLTRQKNWMPCGPNSALQKTQNPQYDHKVRMQMRNSLTLSAEEVTQLLQQNTPHVIRIKMPENETITFTDMIRGEVSFETGLVDDKVLLKGDGMPTYHLAVVADDHAMQITHAFRGEEWLPSAPVHVLVWRHLFGIDAMPQWAHLP